MYSISLSFASGMTLFVQPFSLFAIVLRDLEYSGVLCYTHGYTFTVFIVTIQLSLLMIALDRNYAIMNSLRYPYIFTQRLCYGLIALSWLCGVILAIPALVGPEIGQYQFRRHQYTCTLDWAFGNVVYLGIFSAVTFLFPVLIQGGCYLKIFIAALGHSKRRRQVHPMVTQNSKFQDGPSDSADSAGSGASSTIAVRTTECKAVRTIFLIAFSYCVCWVPYFTDVFLLVLKQESKPSLSVTAICLVFTSSVLNPLIYAYMNRVMRREIWRFVCGSLVQLGPEDFTSTSGNTITGAKHTSKGWNKEQRHRSKSTGGLFSNEMDTIQEEIEETKSEGSYPVVNTPATCSIPHQSIKMTVLPYSDEHLQPSGTAKTHNVHTHFKQLPKLAFVKTESQCIRISDPTTNDEVKPKCKSNTASSRWNIIRTEKFLEEKQRTKRSNLPNAAASRDTMQKQRDCGSFLYFQNENHVKTRPKSFHRSISEMSMNHKTSASELPNLLKFKISVSDENRSKQSLILKSKFGFKRKSHDRTLSQCGASTSRESLALAKMSAGDQLKSHGQRKAWDQCRSFSVPK